MAASQQECIASWNIVQHAPTSGNSSSVWDKNLPQSNWNNFKRLTASLLPGNFVSLAQENDICWPQSGVTASFPLMSNTQTNHERQYCLELRSDLCIQDCMLAALDIDQAFVTESTTQSITRVLRNEKVLPLYNGLNTNTQAMLSSRHILEAQAYSLLYVCIIEPLGYLVASRHTTTAAVSYSLARSGLRVSANSFVLEACQEYGRALAWKFTVSHLLPPVFHHSLHQLMLTSCCTLNFNS